MTITSRFFIVAAALLCLALAEQTQAQTRLGLRGGVYLDQDEAFVGAHLAHRMQRNLRFAPNFEYVLIEQGSLYTINADFLYDLPGRSSTVLWLGGGLGLSRFSFEDFSNNDVGLNLLMGASFGRGPTVPFLQVKVMVMDETQLALGGGITF
ncbi:hypothetical protein KJ068_12380 [bacterium]|nr:hypothetical protein [bacterium]